MRHEARGMRPEVWVVWQGEAAMQRAREMKSLLSAACNKVAQDRAERAFAAWMLFVERRRAG